MSWPTVNRVVQPQAAVPLLPGVSPTVPRPVAPALRLARSAHLELGLALALQCAWLAGRRSRTPAKVHTLLTLPPAKLVQRFLRVASRARSNSAEWHPPSDIIAGQVMALDQQYQALVGRLGSTTCPVNRYELIQWTLAAGGLIHDLMTCHEECPEFRQLLAESVVAFPNCYCLYLV